MLPALAGLLFLSGISALVYQVLWLRLLSLTFGVTIYAASTVLAAFMAGLAVGSFGAGRLADRTRHPLRLFGIVEILIGLIALVTPAALAGVHGVYAGLFSQLAEGTVLAGLVRFIMPFVVLIVPTALMGATLPLVMKSSLTRAMGAGTPRRAALREQHRGRDRRRPRRRPLPDSADRPESIVSPRRDRQRHRRHLRADPVAGPRAR